MALLLPALLLPLRPSRLRCPSRSPPPLRARALAFPEPPPPKACFEDMAFPQPPPTKACFEDMLSYCALMYEVHGELRKEFFKGQIDLEEKNSKVRASLLDKTLSLASLQRDLKYVRRYLFRAKYNLEIRGIPLMFADRQQVYIEPAGRPQEVVRREKWKQIILRNDDFARCLERRILNLDSVEERAEFISLCEEAFHAKHYRAVQKGNVFVFGKIFVFDARAKDVILCMAEELSMAVEFVRDM